MNYSADEVRRLADVFSGAQKKRLSTISGAAAGNWASLPRLAAGHYVRSDTLEKLGRWLEQNWPAGTPWPLPTPRPLPVAPKAPKKSERIAAAE